MKHLQSHLRDIINEVFTSKSKEDALAVITAYLDRDDCAVPKRDRHRIRVFSSRCGTLISLQTYISNSFLKYEGFAVIK